MIDYHVWAQNICIHLLLILIGRYDTHDMSVFIGYACDLHSRHLFKYFAFHSCISCELFGWGPTKYQTTWYGVNLARTTIHGSTRHEQNWSNCNRCIVATVYSRFALSRLCTTDSVHSSLVSSCYQRCRVSSTRRLGAQFCLCEVDTAQSSTRIESTRRSFHLRVDPFVVVRAQSTPYRIVWCLVGPRPIILRVIPTLNILYIL